MTVPSTITLDPERMGGKPCIRGMRVTVGTILGLMAGGRTQEEILSDYPYLTAQDLLDALAYAAWQSEEEVDLPLTGVPPQDEVLAKAVAAIDAHVAWLSESHGSASMGLQLSALAMRLRGDEAWARFRQAHFARMLAAQEEDGAFHRAAQKTSPGTTCDTELRGLADMPGMGSHAAAQKVYVTAICALILALDRAKPRALPPLDAPETPVTTGK